MTDTIPRTDRAPADGPASPQPSRGGPRGLRAWARDLSMGARFALHGRQGWARTLLTGVGVGLGVAMLLLATSVPQIIASQDARGDARSGAFQAARTQPVKPGPHSVLSKDANNRVGGDDIYGRLVQAEGSDPALPPGVRRLPRPGEMVVSPELKALLASPDGAELRKRYDARVVGTIGDEGLVGPHELAVYLGSSRLADDVSAVRTNGFGGPAQTEELDPFLLLLIVVACAVLIMPIAVFIGTAVRFGGERRDARLAALRLVGADAAMARRIAAGESLVGAVTGLLLGAVLFLAARQLADGVVLFRFSVFPSDVLPSPSLTVLILVAVPLSAIAVTVFALRGVAIEPLGLVRQSEQRRRRLWWRVLPPLAGLALLLPMAGSISKPGAQVDSNQIVAAVVLLLAGVALLLPWLVERIVGRLHGGPLAWQLATRRLQLSGASASRAVSGITIAVAGAIALQMLFSTVEAKETQSTGMDTSRSQAVVFGPQASVARAASFVHALRGTRGVRRAEAYVNAYAPIGGMKETSASIVLGGCSTLRELARIDDCRDGRVYLVGRDRTDGSPHPGDTLLLDDTAKAGPDADPNRPETPASRMRHWAVPRSARQVESRKAPGGETVTGVLATPGALPEKWLGTDTSLRGWVVTRPGDATALDHLRTTVFRFDPAASVFPTVGETHSDQFETVRRCIFAASTAVLVLIGASMVVTQIEQLRERKRQLSVLVAFGTTRRTLGASVLWQTAVPVVLGLALAAVFGLGLGWALLRLLSEPRTDWLAFLPVMGVGAGVIAVVTLVSLPPLWRMMRPDGLRTE